MEPGRRIGDYEVIGEIGRGGMGRVYKVRHVIANRLEAMKLILADAPADSELAARFLREIRVLAALEHPNIAALRTAVTDGDRVAMVMELVDGEPLSKRLRQGPIPIAEAVGIHEGVLAALAYAHDRGVVHRDVKPSNILVTRDGTVKLTDFGIARAEADQALTASGTTTGSVPYMSPEQIRGGAIDARSDLYSVGISLYESLTGRTPFQGSEFEVMSAQVETPPPSPRSLRPELPRALEALVLRAIAKHPDDRFPSAAAFRAALQSAGPIAAPVEPTRVVVRSRSATTGRLSPLAWAALGALLVVFVAAGTGAYLRRAEAIPDAPGTGAIARPEVPQAPAPQGPPPGNGPLPTDSPGADPPRPSFPGATATGPSQPASQAPAVATPAPPAPVPPDQTVVPAPAAPLPAGAPVSQPDATASEAAELTALLDQFDRLAVRAAAVNDSLDTLRQQQARQGLGLRSDMAGRQQAMNLALARADEAIGRPDPAAARRSLTQARGEIEALERFLGR